MPGRVCAAVLAAAVLFRFAPVPAPESFSDVPADAWYYADIQACREAGVIRGGGDGFFRPEDAVTAGEFLTMLFNLGHTLGAYDAMRVTGEEWLDAAKLLNGRLCAYFTDFTVPLNRGELAFLAAGFLRDVKLCSEAADAAGPVHIFPDVYGLSCAGDTEFLASLGLVSGIASDDGKLFFCPDITASRAEAAVLAHRMLDLF